MKQSCLRTCVILLLVSRSAAADPPSAATAPADYGAKAAEVTAYLHKTFYDPDRGVWHQTWIDSSAGLLVLEGAFRDGAMTMSDRNLPGKKDALHRRWFRMGIATGELTMHVWASGQRAISGYVPCRAARLEPRSPAGGLLIDQQTFDELGPDLPRRT